jgi:hypothetical protein
MRIPRAVLQQGEVQKQVLLGLAELFAECAGFY